MINVGLRDFLRKKSLRQDDIAVVVAASWQIMSEMFDRIGGIGGPVPTLFTAQPAELREKLVGCPDQFYAELNRFMTR